MSRTIYFLSDAHLGAGTPEEEARKMANLKILFRRLLDERASLIVLGDLFDFWFEYRTVIQAEHFQVLGLLRELVASGCRVTMLAGNHDFWFGDFLKKNIGLQIAGDFLTLEVDGRRFFLAHGDGLGPGDWGYKILRAILRFPFHIRLYRLIHPDLGIPLAKFCSRISRNHITRDRYLKRDPLWPEAKAKFSQGYDAVILGHIHIPVLRKEDGKIYCNLGDFISHFTYGRLAQGNLTLERIKD